MEDGRDETELITRYFNQGFEYREICALLSRRHGVNMSERTLRRRLALLGLTRCNRQYNMDVVRNTLLSLRDGPESSRGYHAMWHHLQMKGVHVPRTVVENLMREIDPKGVEVRRAHRLRRRVYANAGPNDVWHCDGYDKLKPYGFPIHGCIDGWSRKIIWLYTTRSNNRPQNIGAYYLEAVDEIGGCPVQLVTDLGTENGLMAGMQCFFRNDIESHRYVPSPRNQRIEGWWSFFRRSHSTWWMNFFKDRCDSGEINLADEMAKECLWFCFASLLQQQLNLVKEHWNTHYIRSSRFDTVQGRPDSLFYWPEQRGGQVQLALSVPENEISYAREHLIEGEAYNDYQEYFKYLVNFFRLEEPRDWRDTLNRFHQLMNIANQGDDA